MRKNIKNNIQHFTDKISYTQIIAIGFIVLILTGTFLLHLPFAARTGTRTPFIDCLFTAASATCVTGLTVVDTAMHWSVFGQIVLVFLIQIGGLGFMSVITMVFLFFKKQVTLRERRLLLQSAGDNGSVSFSNLIKRILAGTFIFEGAGIILLAFFFCPKLGFFKGMWYSVFHSVSAFCNAGFDLMTPLGSASFKLYYSNIYINIILMLLIITGGIGFIVWNDILINRLHFKKYGLHTKIVLCITGILLFSGTLLYLIFERNDTLADMNFIERLIVSAFQTVSARTAGFYTVDLSKMSEGGNLLITLLMMIGGNPGSTAGGMKTTTVAVILVMVMRCASTDTSVVFFKKKIPDESVKQACTIGTVYASISLFGTLAVCAIENCTLRQGLFEVVSAINTVGSTQGLTPGLCTVSRLIIIFLMYAGRIGGFSLVLALSAKKNKIPLSRPTEKILIG